MRKIPFLLFILISFSFVFISCGGDENNDNYIYSNEIKLISLLPDKYNIVLNDIIEEQDFFTFKVTNNAGLDITGEAKIFVNDIEINTNIFTPTELGTFQAYAMYVDEISGKEFLSEDKFINVIDAIDNENLYFKHKVLVEDFTGTWCGWCTRIIYALELIESQTPDVIPVAIHNNDEFNYVGRIPLEDYLQIGGIYPFAAINRKMIWANPQDHNVSQPIEQIQPESPIGIKINSNLGSSSGMVDISFSFKETIPGQLEYVIYIVENGLIAHQNNYNATLYGGVMPTLSNFVHNHTLRGVYGNILGNSLEQQATEGSEITLSNLSVNYTSENVNNLQVVAFIIDAQGNVLNAQIADRNIEKDYEFAL